MVATDIDINSAAVSSSMTSSPKWRNTATSSASIGAREARTATPATGPGCGLSDDLALAGRRDRSYSFAVNQLRGSVTEA